MPCSSACVSRLQPQYAECCSTRLSSVWEDFVWKQPAPKSQVRGCLKIGFWTANRGCHSQEAVRDGEVWQGSILATLLFPSYIEMIFACFRLETNCCSGKRRPREEAFLLMSEWWCDSEVSRPVCTSVLIPGQSALTPGLCGARASSLRAAGHL